MSVLSSWFRELRRAKNGTCSARLLIAFIISYMESTNWVPSEEEREVMEAVWMQVKGACEKLKEETNAKDEHIRKMLQEMAKSYYS
ncbi:hypothetical protein [Prochlorococcus sp. MIT 1341]|uniref:hypothetical protein n=1 Tax=Prochlorococcus sp. MIT 1341 TaxID=3096221 RepID=UPI002A74F100|nr:hypothetical protein [Prochlorococcus sp. MIT 1341]